jgi:hypothetical protein
VKDTYLRAGYTPTPERREAAHFWWLAGYQCCGWTKNRIATAAHNDPAAVIHALKNLAEEIDLTLRAPEANDPSWTVEKIRTALGLSPVT